MTHQQTPHQQRRTDGHGAGRSSAVSRRMAHTTFKALIAIGFACGLAFVLAANDFGHAADSARTTTAKVSDRRTTSARISDTLSTLERLPSSVRDSFQAASRLSSKEVCRIAEGLVKSPAMDGADAIAKYLSKDLNRWSARLAKSDPDLAKAVDKGEFKEAFLQQWTSGRGTAQRWLQGCGMVVTVAIGRYRQRVERDTPDMVADIASQIAIGVRKNDPDAIAAAEALARAEKELKVLLK